MSVFYSRSVYVSTSWRETRGCCLTTHRMNCHRRGRSGVYCLLVHVCEFVWVSLYAARHRCFVSVNHRCVLICCGVVGGQRYLEKQQNKGEMKRGNRGGGFLCVKSRCHLNEYEPLNPKSHHQHWDSCVTEWDLIIKKQCGPSPSLLPNSSLICLFLCCLIKTLPLSHFSPY